MTVSSWNPLLCVIDTCNKRLFKTNLPSQTNNQKQTNKQTHQYCDFLLWEWKDQESGKQNSVTVKSGNQQPPRHPADFPAQWDSPQRPMSFWVPARGGCELGGSSPSAEQCQCPMPGLPISLSLSLLWPSVARARDLRPPWPWTQSTYRSLRSSSCWDQPGLTE